ncbi:hypothetical protein EJ02DRAFT_482230, partial [Clathrospora elynae]
FEATGISPLDPDVILRRFTNISPADQSSRESSVSVLSASDWRKIERLLRVVANGSRTKHTQRLSQTIHSMSVKQQLIQHENEGLREALSIQKRRQKRGKPLPLEQPEEYYGGAVLWTPRKVKKAREQLEQKEHEGEQLQQQKAEAAEQWRSDQQLKARLIQERRVARAEARVAKAKKKADLAENQRVQQARKQLQACIKLFKKSRKQGLKTIKRNKLVMEAAGSSKAGGAAIAYPTSQSQSGRSIKTPSRYK